MLGFIGTGKVGTSLLRFFYEYRVHKGLEELCISSVFSEHRESINEALDLIKALNVNSTHFSPLPEVASSAAETAEKSDIIFVTVPDSVIAQVDRELFLSAGIKLKGKILVHCSGVLTAKEGFIKCSSVTDTVSLHPMLAFCSKLTSLKSIENAFFTLEGSDNGVKKLESILQKLNLAHAVLHGSKEPEKMKAEYHLASVMVSNCVTGLFSMGQDLLTGCGFSEIQAHRALVSLFSDNVKNIITTDVSKALTGPVERADAITVKKHLDCLDEEDRELYRLISKKLLRIAQDKNPERDYDRIKKLLYTEDEK